MHEAGRSYWESICAEPFFVFRNISVLLHLSDASIYSDFHWVHYYLQLFLLPSTRSICRWTWKDPLVNAIWNQLGLACGWICIRGFIKLLTLSLFAFVSAAEYLSQQQLAADFRLKAEGHPSPAIFQQTVLWNHVYCLQKFWTRCQCFSQLSVFVWLASSFLSCSKSWIKRPTALFLTVQKRCSLHILSPGVCRILDVS